MKISRAIGQLENTLWTDAIWVYDEFLWDILYNNSFGYRMMVLTGAFQVL